jgi:hypothetical protein
MGKKTSKPAKTKTAKAKLTAKPAAKPKPKVQLVNTQTGATQSLSQKAWGEREDQLRAEGWVKTHEASKQAREEDVPVPGSATENAPDQIEERTEEAEAKTAQSGSEPD